MLALSMDLKGISSSEAAKLLRQHGPNSLPEKPPPSNFKIVLEQLKSPLVYILLAALLVTIFLKEFTDAFVIFFAVFLNTVLGFIQEKKASNALAALKKLIHPQATVIRDGKRKKIEVENVVPGDICVLNHGDKIPADGQIKDSHKLLVDEALLTGESVPVLKDVGNKVLMGTSVVSGSAQIVVEKTGEETEVGKIALSVQEPFEDTPLKRQLAAFSKQLTYLVLILVTTVFVVGLISGRGIVEIFSISVALAVSSIPEGLLVGLTVVLAIGMQRILKHKGLVRNLVSAETLGGVTTICVDKTGTLTEGEMKVVDFVGDEKDISFQVTVANDLDDPIVVAANTWAKKVNKVDSSKYSVIDTLPFSSETRFFASLNKWDSKNNMLFVNGAPEYVAGWSGLSKSAKKDLEEKIDEYTQKGMRVLGLARRKVSKNEKKIKNPKANLEWIGILVFSDPIRSGVKDALAKAMSAGVKVMVITGDYANTAISVMKNLGIELGKENVILGSQLDRYSEQQLAKKLSSPGVKLFARTTPQQKLKIVEALQKNGEVVAMTGDGVNDAPALNRADIGIVVGEATDVAKESSDLVLLDSHFGTIVSAIEEGRGIFDNIRKIILYLMSDAFEEIIAVLGAMLLGLPILVSAVQILWINLVSDGFPHLALTLDLKRKDIMSTPPRNPKEALVSSWMKKLILIVSSVGGIVALSLFYYYYQTQGILMARSVAFATLGVNSLIYVFSVRTLMSPFWVENPFSNKWLNVAVIGGFFLQVVPFMTPWTRNFLHLTSLSISAWVIVIVSGLFMFVVIEVLKYVFRRHLNKA